MASLQDNVSVLLAVFSSLFLQFEHEEDSESFANMRSNSLHILWTAVQDISEFSRSRAQVLKYPSYASGIFAD